MDQAYFELILSQANEGLLVLHEDLIQYANPAAAKVLGAASPVSLHGRPLLEYIWIEGWTELATQLVTATATDYSTIPLVATGQLAVEPTARIAVSVQRVELADQPVLLLHLPVAADAHVPAQSGAELQTVLSTAPVGIGMTRHRVFVWVNQHLCKMIGLTADELIGHSTRVLYATDEEYQRVGAVKYEQIERSGSGAVRTTWQCRDGTLINIDLRSRAINPNDLNAGVIFTALDITQEKIAEAALLEALNAAENTNRQLHTEIRERSKVQDELRASELRWQFALEGAGDGVWDWNVVTDEVFFSKRWKTMLGYAEHEIGHSVEDWKRLIHPDDFVDAIAEVERHLSGQTPLYVCEYRLKCKDGTYKWILDRGKVLSHDEAGRPLRVVGTHTDITERKLAEDALLGAYDSLEESNQQLEEEIEERQRAEKEAAALGQRLRLLVDAAPYGAHEYELMPDGRLVFLSANAAAERILNFDHTPVYGLTIEEAFPALSGTVIPQAYREVARTGKIHNQEQVNYDQDEIVGCFEIVAVQTQPNRMAVFFRDVTERKRAEEALRAAYDSLGEANQQLEAEIEERRRVEQALQCAAEEWQSTFDAVNDMVWMLDQDNRIIRANRATHTMFGFDRDAILGRHCWEVMHGSDTPLSNCPVLAMQRSRQREYLEFELQHRSYQVTADPRFDAAGQLTGAVHLVREITAEAKLRTELERSAKLETVGMLAGRIAHDFNNLLAAISGNVSLAQSELGGDARVTDYLVDAERACFRARDLTQQLLTFAAGGAPQKKLLHLPEVIGEATRFALAGSRHICRIEIAPDLWPADLDEAQISQVVHNLVLNADQAMPQAGVITVRAANYPVTATDPLSIAPGPYVKLEVVDHGIGIPSDQLIIIFDPFFTTKQRGSGLGLASAYSIIHAHQGWIDVHSQLGAGSTFAIYLPAQPGGQLPAEAPAAAPDLPHARVLVLDDEEMVARMLAEMLKRMGHQVHVTHSGDATLQAFHHAEADGCPYDLLILDLTVPGSQGGREVLAELAAGRPGLRAIATSGYSTDPVMANFQEYGFRGRLAKPYHRAELYDVLRAVLLGEAQA